MKFIVIIPARYQSVRFPGKPLALLGGKPVIQWVYENASAIINDVWVATDDKRIVETVELFGGNAINTPSSLCSGTDRCAYAASILENEVDFDVVINIQGDEPFIKPEQIEQLMGCFKRDIDIATLIKKIESREELFNPNRPKVVIDKKQNAIYFSRSPIPYVRDNEEDKWLSTTTFHAHVGMYAYRKEILREITQLESGKLERAESLEQLRWLENGYRIRTADTQYQSIGIDTPEDLQSAEKWLEK